MSKRVLARVSLGADELVLSVDDKGRVDVRLWTASSVVRMASANGLTLHRSDVPKLIEALHAITREEAA
jgi:hypothetical protein